MPGIKEWLRKSLSDLKSSKKLSDDPETFDCCVFHTHQCVEKILKAFLVREKFAIPKTHDLRFLLELCIKIDPEFLFLRKYCKILNPYGQDSRYPNDLFYVDEEAVDEAVGVAEGIVRSVEGKLEH